MVGIEVVKKTYAFLLFCCQPFTPAYAQNQFDASSYIQAKEAARAATGEHQTVKESEVVIKGVHYLVYRSSAGAIYIPRLNAVSKTDLDQGLCANDIPKLIEQCRADDHACRQRNQDRMTTEVTVVRSEVPLTTNTKAYAELLTTTIQKKCGEVATSYFAPATFRPEIGIEYKDEQKRNPTSYKIYNDSLKPEIGFKSEW